MTYKVNPDRSPQLIESLLCIWEESVRATHHFLNEEDIKKLLPFVQSGLLGIQTLIVTFENDIPTAFTGIEGEKIEMLFVSPACFGRGTGKELVKISKEQYSVKYVNVNEQNPQATGFYKHMGFTVYDRTDKDEQGNPFPLIKMKLE